MNREQMRPLNWEDKVRILKSKFKKKDDMHEYLVTRSKYQSFKNYSSLFSLSGFFTPIREEMQLDTY